MSLTRLRLQVFEFLKGNLLVNWLARVFILFARTRHPLQHLLLFLLVGYLILSFWVVIKSSHTSDLLFPFFGDLNLVNRFGFSWCHAKAKSSFIQKLTGAITFILGSPFRLIVSRANLI